MNDVLAKPFTRDGMVRILKKHLSYMLKDPQSQGLSSDDANQAAGAPGPGPPTAQGYANAPTGMTITTMASGAQVKFEQTPIQSPATTASWHSPGQMQHTSPNLDGGGYMSAQIGSGPGGMVLTPGGSQRPQYANQVASHVGTPTLNRMPDGMVGLDDRPEKRQRLYGPSQGAYVQ
jgi:osomolarity two-component system response regulator SKN7